MKVLRIKYLQIGGLIQKTIEFNNIYIYIYIYIYILMNYLISDITNFYQELKGGCMMDQVGLLIQYCNANFLFQK